MRGNCISVGSATPPLLRPALRAMGGRQAGRRVPHAQDPGLPAALRRAAPLSRVFLGVTTRLTLLV